MRLSCCPLCRGPHVVCDQFKWAPQVRRGAACHSRIVNLLANTPRAQALLTECQLLDFCTAWRDKTPDPEAAIAGALEKGRQRMLRWVADLEPEARFCPAPDQGGIVATVGLYPDLHNEVGSLSWAGLAWQGGSGGHPDRAGATTGAAAIGTLAEELSAQADGCNLLSDAPFPVGDSPRNSAPVASSTAVHTYLPLLQIAGLHDWPMGLLIRGNLTVRAGLNHA